MCVILTLSPGQMISEQKLENAVGNNLHGYGILMHPPGNAKEMQELKNFDPEGTDVEALYEILEYNKDWVRYVHLRNQTKGAISEDNVHPFKVFENETRTVWLMHNGTFFDFSPKEGDPRNDTRIFCENLISPLLNKFEGEFGKGDYNDPLFRGIVSKFSGANRVLLVSTDLQPAYFGDWKEIDALKGGKFLASNNEYFYSITRGPRKSSDSPFRQGNSAVSSTSGSTAPKTETSGTNTSSTQVSHRQPQVPQSSTSRKEEIKTTSATITNLNDVRREAPKFEPSLQLLKSLGVHSSEVWEEYRFSMLDWIKDEEILSLFKKIDDRDKVCLIRDMVTTIQEQEQELATVEMQLSDQEEVEKDLIESNAAHVNEIERLKRRVAVLEEKLQDAKMTNVTEIKQKEAA